MRHDVREIRERLGLTQAELAKRLRVTVQTVSNWENGRSVPTPSIRYLLDELARTAEADK